MSYIPSNIKEFADRKNATRLVNKVARWVESSGKHISGGTAIGKNYNTLILDMKYHGSEIAINLETGEITLFGNNVTSPKKFREILAKNR